MPVYKGTAEVTSGSLKKGATNIENGYKQTDQFYVNTNAITINFVDAISGATMSTTQFSSIGTPGTAFSSFTRTISVNSGRVWLSNPTVSESGDTGGNVNASISGITSTSATLNVSGTHPNTGVTVTLTVNGSTQVDLPNLNVGKSGNYPTVSTADGGSLNTVNYSVSNSSGCSGGTSGSGSYNFGSSSSGTWYSYSRPGLVAGPYGNGCGETCNSTVTFSKSGYDAGSTTFSQTGSTPSFTNTYYWSPSSNPSGASLNTPATCNGSCPTCNNCTGTCTNAYLTASITAVQGGGGWRIGSTDYSSYTVASGLSATNGQTFTNSINATNMTWPSAGSLSLNNNGQFTSGSITGINATLNFSNPSGSTRGAFYYTVSGTGSGGGSCSYNNRYIGSWASSGSQTFNVTCSGNIVGTASLTLDITTSSPNLGSFGSISWSV